MINKYIRKFFRPQLSEEAFWAYFHRLPEKIQVRWFRDNKYIIGEIIIDNKKYLTQGNNANDFIDMVTDMVTSVYEIPDDYIEAVKQHHAFQPSAEERAKLENENVKKSEFGFNKRRKECIKFA